MNSKLKEHVLIRRFIYLLKMASPLIKTDALNRGLEVLRHILAAAKNDFKGENLVDFVEELKKIFSQCLICVLNKQKVEIAAELYEYTKGELNELLVIEPQVLRGLVVCFSKNNLLKEAKELFHIGFDKNIYYINRPELEDMPWCLTILSSWTKYEIKLVIEMFVEMLFPVLLLKHSKSEEESFKLKINFVEDENFSSDIFCLEEPCTRVETCLRKTCNVLGSLDPGIEWTENISERTLLIQAETFYNFWKKEKTSEASTPNYLKIPVLNNREKQTEKPNQEMHQILPFQDGPLLNVASTSQTFSNELSNNAPVSPSTFSSSDDSSESGEEQNTSCDSELSETGDSSMANEKLTNFGFTNALSPSVKLKFSDKVLISPSTSFSEMKTTGFLSGSVDNLEQSFIDKIPNESSGFIKNSPVSLKDSASITKKSIGTICDETSKIAVITAFNPLQTASSQRVKNVKSKSNLHSSGKVKKASVKKTKKKVFKNVSKRKQKMLINDKLSIVLNKDSRTVTSTNTLKPKLKAGEPKLNINNAEAKLNFNSVEAKPNINAEAKLNNSPEKQISSHKPITPPTVKSITPPKLVSPSKSEYTPTKQEKVKTKPDLKLISPPHLTKDFPIFNQEEFDKITHFLKTKILQKCKDLKPEQQHNKAVNLAKKFIQDYNIHRKLDKRGLKILFEFSDKNI